MLHNTACCANCSRRVTESSSSASSCRVTWKAGDGEAGGAAGGGGVSLLTETSVWKVEISME